jgi:hypothetical protein
MVPSVMFSVMMTHQVGMGMTVELICQVKMGIIMTIEMTQDLKLI